MRGQAARDEYPKAADNFCWRFYGLFYLAPAQDSYMRRLRIPNGILSHWQFAGVAGLAEKFGGGYAHVTTRANLQFREVAAKDAIHVIEAVQDLGLTSRGAGADNIRNVTGDATAGIDPGALIDTRPYARAWHFHILNQRTLYGLPRKFNVGFDGGGAIPTLTNDIGFQAVEVEDGAGVTPGIWFKLVVGGITRHRDLARETGAVVKPGETAEVADAIVRVYIAEGDRTNRTKARLKYVLDRYAAEAGSLNGFLAKVEQQLGRPIARVDAKHIRPRPAQDRQAHIGAHPQKQPGLFYLGVVLPVGKMSCAQIRAFAVIARDLGDGDIRLTVWQNLLISGISEGRLQRAKAAVEEAGLEGQQDCGQCGYNCEDYANAIAAQAEDRLNLCVPGAKETARMLKTLVEEMGGGATDPDEAKAKADAKTAAKALDADIRPGSSRNAPAEAVFAGRKRFNREGSEKATYHVEFDISDAGLDYEPGDSFGIFPENDESLVDQVIAAIGAPHDFPTDGKILHQVLREDVSLGLAPDMLFELISYIIGGFSMAKAKALAKGKDPDGDAATLDVLAAVEKFAKLRPDPEAFVEALEPLQPRLFSIASSCKAGPGRVSLTIDHVRYAIGGRERLGVASTFAGTALRPGDKVKAYIQRAHDFALPANADTPIIMVGPGTGVAPFRAFLQECMATKVARMYSCPPRPGEKKTGR